MQLQKWTLVPPVCPTCSTCSKVKHRWLTYFVSYFCYPFLAESGFDCWNWPQDCSGHRRRTSCYSSKTWCNIYNAVKSITSSKNDLLEQLKREHILSIYSVCLFFKLDVFFVHSSSFLVIFSYVTEKKNSSLTLPFSLPPSMHLKNQQIDRADAFQDNMPFTVPSLWRTLCCTDG